MDSSLNSDDIEFVLDLATRAGLMALSMIDNLTIKQKTGPHDLVTNADIALSNLILSELKQRFPDDMHVSEEDESSYLSLSQSVSDNKRCWFIDPIDGTDSYIAKSQKYSVMIGLMQNNSPVFGCIYVPSEKRAYYGGPNYGVIKKQDSVSFECSKMKCKKIETEPVRLIITKRDQKHYPWIHTAQDIEIVPGSSIGLKVIKVIEQQADLLAYLSGKIKYWDTVAPTAIALGSGLEVGSLEADKLAFSAQAYFHETSIVIGKPGSLDWSRSKFKNKE
jgi:3'(2'), 5'-bisphosphate nucleotidase